MAYGQGDGINELREEIRGLRAALDALSIGDCFCGKGIDNPMLPSHTTACVLARKALAGDD